MRAEGYKHCGTLSDPGVQSWILLQERFGGKENWSTADHIRRYDARVIELGCGHAQYWSSALDEWSNDSFVACSMARLTGESEMGIEEEGNDGRKDERNGIEGDEVPWQRERVADTNPVSSELYRFSDKCKVGKTHIGQRNAPRPCASVAFSFRVFGLSMTHLRPDLTAASIPGAKNSSTMTRRGSTSFIIRSMSLVAWTMAGPSGLDKKVISGMALR